MRPYTLLIAAVLAGVPLVGCEKENEAPKTAPPAGPAMPAVDTGKATDLLNKAADAGSDVIAKASDAAATKLDEAMAYIKDNKLDAADKVIAALEKQKASLTPAIQTRIDQARKALDAAKAMVH